MSPTYDLWVPRYNPPAEPDHEQAPHPRTALTLTGYRITTRHRLLLFLQQNGQPMTRWIQLGLLGAGLCCCHMTAGVARFDRGGTRGTFLVRSDPALLTALAADVWKKNTA